MQHFSPYIYVGPKQQMSVFIKYLKTYYLGLRHPLMIKNMDSSLIIGC